jgi:hypothetical protein
VVVFTGARHKTHWISKKSQSFWNDRSTLSSNPLEGAVIAAVEHDREPIAL